MLSPMKNQLSSAAPVAEMSCTSISAICTPLPLSLEGAAVITILIQDMPVKSKDWARVRTLLPVTAVPAGVQVPSVPLVESAETSKW